MGLLSTRAAARFHLILATLIAVSLLSSGTAEARDKYAGAFLKVPAGARAVGMGGAFTAVADDATAAYWNPAGLAFMKYKEVYFQHASMFNAAVQYNYGSLALPMKKEGDLNPAIAISLIQLGVGDIPVTGDAESLRPGVDFEDGDGDPSTSLPTENNGVWDAGERLFLDSDQFALQSNNDWALLFSYARPFGTKFTAGANLKLLYRSLPDINSGSITAWGAGLDAGVTFQPSRNITLSAVAYDLTTTIMVWSTDTREYVSPSFTIGGQYTAQLAPLHMLTLALDLPFNWDGKTLDQRYGTSDPYSGMSGTIYGGAEYWYHNTLALRTGMMGRDLTAGAGIRYKRIGADYAAVFNRFFSTDDSNFAGDGDLGVSHRISGSYNF
jgi:hypothetical protein